MTKTFFQSKTMWFGTGQLFFGVIGLLTGWMDSQTATALILTGFGTIGFRMTTTAPVSGFLPK